MPKSNGWVTHYYQVKCNNCGGEGGWHEEEQYECEHDCGYVGSYVEVERHELTCPCKSDLLSNPTDAPLPGQFLPARDVLGPAQGISSPVSLPVEDDSEQFMNSILDDVDTQRGQGQIVAATY